MELDCSKCPWKTDREACRVCKQEQEADERRTNDLISHDIPGQQERVNAQGWIDNLRQKLENALGLKAWTVDATDAAFIGYMCLRGQEHVHYIRHRVDEEELLDPLYGYQN